MGRSYRFFAHAIFASLFIAPLSVSVLAQRAPDIPSGTTMKVRIIDNLSSDTAEVGDTFHGTLDEPLTVNGRDLYPRGADVSGHVTYVHRSGRLTDPGELDLVLNTVSSGNMASSLAVQPLVIKGESHAKSNATKIGGGAALGAIIGAVAGGGKGAAIGAGVGGAAGTGAAAATGKREAKVESEAVLAFVTSTSTMISSGNAAAGNPGATNAASPASAATEAAPSSAGTAPSASAETTANPPAASAAAPASSEVTDSSDLFTLRDRRVIRNCVAEHASELPPGTVQREDMPTGEERQLYQGGTMSADVQGKAQSLPLTCERQLPRLPTNQERVIYKGRVMLTDNNSRILDLFYLDETK